MKNENILTENESLVLLALSSENLHSYRISKKVDKLSKGRVTLDDKTLNLVLEKFKKMGYINQHLVGVDNLYGFIPILLVSSLIKKMERKKVPVNNRHHINKITELGLQALQKDDPKMKQFA